MTNTVTAEFWDSPLRLLVIYLPILLWVFATFWFRRLRWHHSFTSRQQILLAGSLGMACTAYVIAYIIAPQFSDNVEVAVANVSLAWSHGQPLYHALSAESLYSFLYGPLVFVVNATIASSLGPHESLLKLWGAISTAAGIFFVRALLKEVLGSKLSPSTLWLVLTILATVLISFGHYSFSNRGDGLVFAAIAGIAYLALKPPTWRRSTIMGLLLGLACATKIVAVLYVLPTLALWLGLRYYRSAFMVGSIAAITHCLLFAPTSISWVHYWSWINFGRSHGLSFTHFSWLLAWTLFLTVPFYRKKIISCLDGPQRSWLIGLSLAIIVMFLTGSKIGSGRHHLLPMIPQLILLGAWILKRQPYLSWNDVRMKGWLATVTLYAFYMGCDALQDAFRGYSPKLKTELIDLIRESSSYEVHFGYGAYDHSARLRYLTVAHEHKLFVEPNAFADWRFTDRDFSNSMYTNLERCHQRRWILPKGEPPFSNEKYFNPRFRAVFLASHRKIFSTPSFDVFQCLSDSLH